MMKHYTITAEVPEGQGDYGSSFLTVMNAEPVPSERIVFNVAQRLADTKKTRTLVFVGQDRGRLVYDSLIGPVTAQTEYSFGKPVAK